MKIKHLSGALVLPLALVGCGNDEEYEYAVEGTVKFRQIDYDCGKSHAMGLAAFDAGSGNGGSRGTAPKKSNTSTGNGATLDKAPKAPKSVPNVAPSPTKKPSKKSKDMSCTTEYELLIENNEGLFEQDVTQEHYEKCVERKAFPACTK